ncbi:MAG: hypothetical protein GWP91_10415 [Rhodobacterales bacterium]|nr:hypothetical protein [Rhodobacterales bacterium]
MGVIALTGGGTGGHVYPALAIGDISRERAPRVIYYGDADRLEARVAPARGYKFVAVQAPKYPRGGLSGKVVFGFRLLAAIWSTRGMLKRDKVDVVLGVGGYISAPAILAAYTTGARRIIHEANVVPGAANRLCSKVSQTILLTYERTKTLLKTKAPQIVVGVPVNPLILNGNRAQASQKYGFSANKPTVLFVGGSLGAVQLNELAIATAQDAERSYQVLHLCGQKYHDDVLEAIGDVPAGVKIVAYEDRMADAYAMADLVVCRTGSSTLGEICAVGLPSLMLPSANVTDNHQEENARGLEVVGAGEVLVEREWKLDHALSRVRILMSDDSLRAGMARASREQARLDAATLAADEVEKLVVQQ